MQLTKELKDWKILRIAITRILQGTSQEMAKTKFNFKIKDLSQELKELTKMYKSGDLSKIEFEKAKNKLLLGN